MAVDKYKAIVESSPEFICSFLPDTTLTFVNEALCRALETDRNALLGRPFTGKIPPEELPSVMERIASLSPEASSGSHRLSFPTERRISSTGMSRAFSPRRASCSRCMPSDGTIRNGCERTSCSQREREGRSSPRRSSPSTPFARVDANSTRSPQTPSNCSERKIARTGRIFSSSQARTSAKLMNGALREFLL